MNRDPKKSPSTKDKYQFTAIKANYEDYASGRVIYGAPMATNFPVRLTSEIFQWCKEHLITKGKSGPYVIYDPFCGSGYSLTVLGLLHGDSIKTIYASDADKIILDFAAKNLSLLSIAGLERRMLEFNKLISEHQKSSHKEALESAMRLLLKIQGLAIKTEVFQFNILSDTELPFSITQVDIVLTDVPYGQLTNWEGLNGETNPIQISLDKIKSRLSIDSVVAVVLNKNQKITHIGFTKIKSFILGKRKIVLLEPK